MSKVKIKNVSKTRSPLYCGLADNSSLALQFGQSETIDEQLVTDYIKRRATKGDYLITTVEVSNVGKTSTNSKNSGKTTKKKEV